MFPIRRDMCVSKGGPGSDPVLFPGSASHPTTAPSSVPRERRIHRERESLRQQQTFQSIDRPRTMEVARIFLGHARRAHHPPHAAIPVDVAGEQRQEVHADPDDPFSRVMPAD